MNEEITWENIFKKWVYITSRENKKFPLSDDYFITEIVEDMPWEEYFSWRGRDDLRVKRIPNDVDRLFGYRDPQYDVTASILWLYRDSVEDTVLIWLTTLVIYYDKNIMHFFLPILDKWEKVIGTLTHEYSNRNIERTWYFNTKYILPTSMLNNRIGYPELPQNCNLDDIIHLLYYDVCYIKSHYQLVHCIKQTEGTSNNIIFLD